MTRAPGPPPPDLAQVIEQARQGAPRPSDALRETVHARVTATIGGSGPAGGADGSSGAAGSGAATGTLVKGALAVLLALGGGWALLRSADTATPAAPPELAAEPTTTLAAGPRDVRIAIEPPSAPPSVPSRAAAPPRAVPEDTLALEEALLEQARRGLEADPAAALRRLDMHATRFPDGQLSEERDLLRVRAHLAAGDQAAARAAARAFLYAYPRSIHRTEVESAKE